MGNGAAENPGLCWGCHEETRAQPTANCPALPTETSCSHARPHFAAGGRPYLRGTRHRRPHSKHQPHWPVPAGGTAAESFRTVSRGNRFSWHPGERPDPAAGSVVPKEFVRSTLPRGVELCVSRGNGSSATSAQNRRGSRRLGQQPLICAGSAVLARRTGGLAGLGKRDSTAPLREAKADRRECWCADKPT